MSDIRSDFGACVGQYGLMCLDPGQTVTDNGALWTTEYYMILKRAGLLTEADQAQYRSILEQACMQPRGLTQRYPGDSEQDSPDNMIALAVGSRQFGADFAARMLDYGHTTLPWYVYDQPNPGKFTIGAWMGRQYGMIAFMKICAGRFCGPIGRTWMYCGILLTMLESHDSTSDKLLTQLMVETLPGGPIATPIKWLWNLYIKNAYGGINGVCQIYFDASSPFRKWWI